jgi:hypothetical protein
MGTRVGRSPSLPRFVGVAGVTARLFTPPPAPTGRQWERTIEKGLDHCNYRWTHVRRMRTPDGRWLTGTSSPGFVDYLALREVVLAIECKTGSGRVEPAQVGWLTSFYEAGAYAWVVRPRDDWARLAAWIADPSTAPRVHGFTPLPRLESSVPSQP